MRIIKVVQRLIPGAAIVLVVAGLLSTPAMAQVPGATYTGAFTSQTGIQHFYGGIDLAWGSKTALAPDAPISFTVSPDGTRVTSVTIPSPIRGAYAGYGPGSSAYCEFYFSEPVSLNLPITDHSFSGSARGEAPNQWISFRGSFTGTRDAQGTSPENVAGGEHGAGLRVATSSFPNSYDVPIQDDCTTGYIPWTASTTAPTEPPPGAKAKKARISKVKVSGPAKVRRGSKATYRVKITNSGNDDARVVRIRVNGRGVVSNGLTVPWIAQRRTNTFKLKLRFKKPGKVRTSFKVTSRNAGGKTVKKKIKVRK